MGLTIEECSLGKSLCPGLDHLMSTIFPKSMVEVCCFNNLHYLIALLSSTTVYIPGRLSPDNNTGQTLPMSNAHLRQVRHHMLKHKKWGKMDKFC